MKTTEELFLELLMVSIGKMDCLSRGPEPEEWGRLYELSKHHKVEGITYQGVVKLFEYGLRAPQDVSLEWMSEAEMIKESNEQAPQVVSSARYYPNDLKDWRRADDDDLLDVERITIQHVYGLYRHNSLTMRALMDYHYTLLNTSRSLEPIRCKGLSFELFKAVGIRRFARGIMWLLQQSFGMERTFMLCEPFEQEGSFIFASLTQSLSFRQRLWHRLLYGYSSN